MAGTVQAKVRMLMSLAPIDDYIRTKKPQRRTRR